MKTQAVAALKVADEEFIVASLIERCPKAMMIRELMMNALEAVRTSRGDNDSTDEVEAA